jgi:O-acetyl-ADP-ribose deacetylase (regulator of RNase III)
MKYIKGDLLELFDQGEFDVIIHGCNCQKKMKSGIAGQIAQKYPIVPERDLMTTDEANSKLGTVDFIHLPDSRIICNAYTQLNYGRDKDVVYVDYHALSLCFNRIENYLSNLEYLYGKQLKIGIPKIGAGLANGDWKTIECIIEEESRFLDITVVEYDK